MLCPAQAEAFAQLQAWRPHGRVFVLDGASGCGRTTIAREAAREFGAAWLDGRDLFESMRTANAWRMEEQWCGTVLAALQAHKRVVVDDWDLAHFMAGGCHFYPRTGALDAALEAVCEAASAQDAWLLFVGTAGDSLRRLSLAHVGVPRFKVADQRFLFEAALGAEACKAVDFDKIYRYAPRLTARAIAKSAVHLRKPGLTTERVLDYLREMELATNVDLGQVEAVGLNDLFGVDDVIAKLESNIILPLEDDELAKRFNLTPRRGVLLYGPPGTGKTTVGRALAHRLKSKFFLFDGTVIAGTSDFYSQMHRIFEAAKQQAPAVVFIDDSDVIFENGDESGLYRYLLTILDGIESEEAGRLTVMLTAMNVAHLPPALIRSGRIELWLEMRLPDGSARRKILEARVAASVPEKFDANFDALVQATEGFTGADLRRMVEDGKNVWAYAVSKGEVGDPNEHFFAAAGEVAKNKRLLATAEATASAHFPTVGARISMMKALMGRGVLPPE